MSHSCDHSLHKTIHHFGWDRANPPALKVAPGDTVEFETIDASGGQLSARSTAADIAGLDFWNRQGLYSDPLDATKAIDGGGLHCLRNGLCHRPSTPG
jgi:acetamidase/formamidase